MAGNIRYFSPKVVVPGIDDLQLAGFDYKLCVVNL